MIGTGGVEIAATILWWQFAIKLIFDIIAEDGKYSDTDLRRRVYACKRDGRKITQGFC